MSLERKTNFTYVARPYLRQAAMAFHAKAFSLCSQLHRDVTSSKIFCATHEGLWSLTYGFQKSSSSVRFGFSLWPNRAACPNHPFVYLFLITKKNVCVSIFVHLNATLDRLRQPCRPASDGWCFDWTTNVPCPPVKEHDQPVSLGCQMVFSVLPGKNTTP